MSDVLRVAIADPDDSSRESLKAMLLGLDRIWLEAECSRYEFFADVVEQTKPDIGLVTIDHDSDKAIALVKKVSETTPNVSVAVVSSSSDGNLILRAMRAGAKEFLTSPLPIEDFVAALERISAQRFGRDSGRSRSSKLYAVAGATGGVGSTSLAVNLGCAMAQDTNQSVVLVDLDLSLGDADVFLDAIPDYTLSDVAENADRLDFTLLKRSLTKHSSGLFLLPRPVHIQDSDQITTEDLQRVIGLLRATFTHVILDLSKGYTKTDLAAMQRADEVLLVIQLDLPCLRNVVRLMAFFAELDGVKEKVRVIVNRQGIDSGQITLKKAQETIGKEIFWQLPNDYRTMVECRNNGVPLVDEAPKAKITSSIFSLAAALSGSDLIGEAVEGGSSISRLMSLFPSRQR
ncbi:MAG: cellulose synthase operon protein YhjQ/BcsQ [Pirellulales bacterium]|nr:MinD/ParA family protein [Planctomycetales bacterium]